MKVLIINGSPREDGNTSIAIREMGQIFATEGVDYETVQVGNKFIVGCTGCGGCHKKGYCIWDDEANRVAKTFEKADALIVASPVYYASAPGQLISFLDKLFYSTHFDKTMKVGASIVCARRGGCSSTFDEINKFFTISGMPVASSQYWNSIHGLYKGDAEFDEEGKQIMRTLARNVVFLMRSIALGKEKYGLPEKETKIATNFIRYDKQGNRY